MAPAQQATWDDVGKLILRLTMCGLLLFHGIAKILHGIGPIMGDLERIHLPAFIGYGVYIGEVVAPLLIILGLWTRASALIVAFDLLVAILLVKLPMFFTLARSGAWANESEAFYLLLALVIFFQGAGRLAIRGDGGRWG